MRILIVALLFGAALATGSSKLSVFVPEDDAAAFEPAKLLSQPVFVVAKKAPGSPDYKSAAIITGLNGPDVKSDPKYAEIANVLNSPTEKFALFTDIKKFYSKSLFDTPLPAGDSIIIPSYLKIENYKLQNVPVLFLTEPDDFTKFHFDKLKLAGVFEIASGEIKPVV